MPRHAAAEDHHLARLHAGGAAEQHAAAALRLFQMVRARLDRHPARHLAHRGQERQAAAGGGDRLIGDGGAARGHQSRGLLRVRGEVQIGEQHLAGLQHPAFGELRLLDLDDHFRLREHRRRIGQQLRAGGGIVGVGGSDAQPAPAWTSTSWPW